MRINWFSPLLPSRTDIAHFTSRLLPALSAKSEVVLWTDQPHWYPGLQKQAEVRRFDPGNMDWAGLEHAGATFYNMGNDARFHSGIWEVARHYPGFAIMHDVFMHDSVWFHHHKKNDRAGYVKIMESLYGASGRRDAEFHWDGVLSLDQMGRLYTCAPYMLQSGLGAIVHSRAGERTLQREVAVPVTRLALPFPARNAPGPHSSPPPWSLVVFGYLGSNRCLEQILTAFEGLENRDSFRLHIYGQIHDGDAVSALIARLQLGSVVTVHGFVPEAELNAALAGAHLALNLRFPTKGEASGSQLRIWSHALPSIVTKIGWYAEQPEDTAVFIRPEAIVEDLRARLDEYRTAPGRFRECGMKGYEHLVRTHSTQQYAAAILEMGCHSEACLNSRQAPRAAGANASPHRRDSRPPARRGELEEILDLASRSAYDFRLTAHPGDPLHYLFEEWVPYYRLKWAIARALQPRRILEIGVRFGYSAAAFLDACPDAVYLGIDNDSDTFGGQQGAIQWARQITRGARAEYMIADSQQLETFPGGCYDLVHIDGQQDGAGSIADLRKALKQAGRILVDGYFWSRDNFLHISEFLFRYRDLIESCAIIPGYAGELLITPRQAGPMPGRVVNSSELKDTYTDSYYLRDCGGFDAYKRDKGVALSDQRFQSIIQLAEIAPVGRALDLGCGRGEIGVHLAAMGHKVLAVDYSESAINLARTAAEAAGVRSRIGFHRGDVNQVRLSGLYDVAVASDLIEHLSPAELDCLYSRIAAHLAPEGLLVIHTFPNAWYYKYEHPRRLREARKLEAYVPLEPRSRYEELMHINEQSPRVLKRQLRAHFEHVLLWFAAHDLADPMENLRRPFSIGEQRAAGDLFALASHSRIDASAVLDKVEMHPLTGAVDLTLEIVTIPAAIPPLARFQARVRLRNRSGIHIKSRMPNPVRLSYHCYSEDRQTAIFDGRRTSLSVLRPGSVAEVDMDLEAPGSVGRFLFRLTLVQESVRWFDEAPEKLFAEQWIEVRNSAEGQ